MKNAYVPVIKQTFVNLETGVAYTLRLSLHNVPRVTRLWTKLGTGKAFERKFWADSREAARAKFDATIERLLDKGFMQVA